jgi:hypothetical protein
VSKHDRFDALYTGFLLLNCYASRPVVAAGDSRQETHLGACPRGGAWAVGGAEAVVPGGGAAGGGAELGPRPLPGGHGTPATPLQDSFPPGRKKEE